MSTAVERAVYARMREGPFDPHDLYRAAKAALGLTGRQPAVDEEVVGIFTSDSQVMRALSGRWILAA